MVKKKDINFCLFRRYISCHPGYSSIFMDGSICFQKSERIVCVSANIFPKSMESRKLY